MKAPRVRMIGLNHPALPHSAPGGLPLSPGSAVREMVHSSLFLSFVES